MSDWNPTPPGWTSTRPATPRVGEEVWRVTKGGRTISCELYNEERLGAGWDVAIRQDGELSFSRRCPDEAFARSVANALRQDHLKTGWADDDSPRRL
jgi:hypothetical protein